MNWELICHHTYDFGGLPIDLSSYNSNGQSNDVDVIAGVKPETRSVAIHRIGSRIAISPNAGWTPLDALRVEATVFLDPDNPPQMLISGAGAFAIFFGKQGVLYANFHGTSTNPLQNNNCIDSENHSATGATFKVQGGHWATVGFMHDGFATMELSVNRTVVAQRKGPLDRVPGVGSAGICIGNATGSDNVGLGGRIEEIKVWRKDPNEMRRQFVSRPMDKKTTDCWNRFIRALNEALTERPDCARELGTGLTKFYDHTRRAIAAKGPTAHARYQKARKEYDKLWRKGQLKSPAMKKLIADWCAWLKKEKILPAEKDPQLQKILKSKCLKDVLKDLPKLNCDPNATALLKMIAAGLKK